MNVTLNCEACGETVSIILVHAKSLDDWGKTVLCRDQLEDLTSDLKAHRRDICRHYKDRKLENLLKAPRGH